MPFSPSTPLRSGLTSLQDPRAALGRGSDQLDAYPHDPVARSAVSTQGRRMDVVRHVQQCRGTGQAASFVTLQSSRKRILSDHVTATASDGRMRSRAISSGRTVRLVLDSSKPPCNAAIIATDSCLTSADAASSPAVDHALQCRGDHPLPLGEDVTEAEPGGLVEFRELVRQRADRAPAVASSVPHEPNHQVPPLCGARPIRRPRRAPDRGFGAPARLAGRPPP